jgi:hypothetical protein
MRGPIGVVDILRMFRFNERNAMGRKAERDMTLTEALIG